MRVFAAPFKGTAPNASVLVGVELLGRDLSLDTNSKVEFSYMAIDTKSKICGARTDSITMNLKPETKTRVEQTGFRMLNRIELPAGRYQLRRRGARYGEDSSSARSSTTSKCPISTRTADRR